MDRVKGKVAIVTGGANGIGEATAKLLAEEGASVCIIDIVDDKGKQVVEEIKAAGGDAVYEHADQSKEEEVKNAFAKFWEKYGKLHILVNNAGVGCMGGPAHLSNNDNYNYVMDTNVRGVVFCVKHAMPYMLKTGPGSVVNVCSIYGIVASDVPFYDASKGALRALTKSDAILYAGDKIRFNSVHPGNVKTPLFEQLVDRIDPEGVSHAVEMLSVTNPLDRMAEPKDIAYGILYLASDESSYVNGIELVIDGGYINCPFAIYTTNTVDWRTLKRYRGTV